MGEHQPNVKKWGIQLQTGRRSTIPGFITSNGYPNIGSSVGRVLVNQRQCRNIKDSGDKTTSISIINLISCMICFNERVADKYIAVGTEYMFAS